MSNDGRSLASLAALWAYVLLVSLPLMLGTSFITWMANCDESCNPDSSDWRLVDDAWQWDLLGGALWIGFLLALAVPIGASALRGLDRPALALLVTRPWLLLFSSTALQLIGLALALYALGA